ncbi:MAG: OadG family protein [Opitutales bacterium]|nr:OadG family protein [Opitutales bacterium]
MPTIHVLANAFTESLEHIVGFLSVLITLTVLWMLTLLIGKYFSNSANRKAASAAKAQPPAKAEASGPPAAGQDAVSDEEIAAVAAATYLLLGSGHRIVSIQSSSTSWSQEGRRQHFASHKIR